MTRYVVDTNVAVIANGVTKAGERPPSIFCQVASIKFLQRLLSKGRVLVDLEGAIQAEYHKRLHPSGQPGVGDRFYQAILNSAPNLIERIPLPINADGEYVDLPQELIDVNFHRDDRMFAALANRERVPVANATDSDWLEHESTIKACGIVVNFICGKNMDSWFK